MCLESSADAGFLVPRDAAEDQPAVGRNGAEQLVGASDEQSSREVRRDDAEEASLQLAEISLPKFDSSGTFCLA